MTRPRDGWCLGGLCEEDRLVIDASLSRTLSRPKVIKPLTMAVRSSTEHLMQT